MSEHFSIFSQAECDLIVIHDTFFKAVDYGPNIKV